MWELKEPKPVKLVVGILAADQSALSAARIALTKEFGEIDLAGDIWPFEQTRYYERETGQHILRQFVSLAKLIGPGKLADIKHQTNAAEQALSHSLAAAAPRPVNLDPGLIEPSKLVLASTKNYSHRIYIGRKMYAEVTLVFDKGTWHPLPYTYPDYRDPCYHEFFSAVRTRLLEQLRALKRNDVTT
jgi:hypothetical protein